MPLGLGGARGAGGDGEGNAVPRVSHVSAAGAFLPQRLHARKRACRGARPRPSGAPGAGGGGEEESAGALICALASSIASGIGAAE